MMASEDIISNQPLGLQLGTEGIKYPGKHDVMLGRGGESNNHSGNLIFRQFAENFKEKYRMAMRNKKPEVAMEVVRAWRTLSPPGRFLARTHPDRADSLWHVVSDDLARKRVSKTLGEQASASRQKKRATAKAARSGATANRALSDTTATTEEFTAGNTSTDGRSSEGNSSAHDESLSDQEMLLKESQLTMAAVWDTQYPQPRPQLQQQQEPQYHQMNVHSGDHLAGFQPYAITGAHRHRTPAAESYASPPAHLSPCDLESINDALNQLPSAASLAGSVFNDDGIDPRGNSPNFDSRKSS